MSRPNQQKAMIVIHVFLALQLLAPLSYYAWRSDHNDERFAWRMFSSVRMVQCRAEFRTGDDQKPVKNLHSTFHEAWLELAKRGRRDVIGAMAKELCSRQQVDEPEVRVQVTCSTLSGDVERFGGSWNQCALESL